MSTTIVPDSARRASANRSSSAPMSASGSVISPGISGISGIAIAAADVKLQQHDIRITIAMYRLNPDIKDRRGRESRRLWTFLLLAGC